MRCSKSRSRHGPTAIRNSLSMPPGFCCCGDMSIGRQTAARWSSVWRRLSRSICGTTMASILGLSAVAVMAMRHGRRSLRTAAQQMPSSRPHVCCWWRRSSRTWKRSAACGTTRRICVSSLRGSIRAIRSSGRRGHCRHSMASPDGRLRRTGRSRSTSGGVPPRRTPIAAQPLLATTFRSRTPVLSSPAGSRCYDDEHRERPGAA